MILLSVGPMKSMVQGLDMIQVEVIYALPDKASTVTVQLDDNATLGLAIIRSGLLERFPEIDLARNEVGIFSKPGTADTPLKDGDRVEIYRPLRVDPKEARRRRAAKRNRDSG